MHKNPPEVEHSQHNAGDRLTAMSEADYKHAVLHSNLAAALPGAQWATLSQHSSLRPGSCRWMSKITRLAPGEQQLPYAATLY